MLFQEDVNLAPDEDLDVHVRPVDHRVRLSPATPGNLSVRLIGDPDGPEALELVSAWFDAPPARVVVGIGGVPLELAGSIGRNRGRDRTSVDSGVEVDVEALAANRFAVGLAQLGVDVEGLLEVEDLKGGSVREGVGDVVRPEGTDLGDHHARVREHWEELRHAGVVVAIPVVVLVRVELDPDFGLSGLDAGEGTDDLEEAVFVRDTRDAGRNSSIAGVHLVRHPNNPVREVASQLIEKLSGDYHGLLDGLPGIRIDLRGVDYLFVNFEAGPAN